MLVHCRLHREVVKKRGQEYKLLWKESPDFVRLAAKCNALIVPFAAVGADDAYDVSTWELGGVACGVVFTAHILTEATHGKPRENGGDTRESQGEAMDGSSVAMAQSNHVINCANSLRLRAARLVSQAS